MKEVDNLFISVVIPLYNAEGFISRSIESVLSQSFTNIELIVINDGSIDNSLAEVKKFHDSRIRLISQENLGVSAARNRGISEAKFEFVAFLDADDEWLPDFLKNIVSLIRDFPDCGLFATNYWIKQLDSCEQAKVLYVDGWKGIMPDYFRDLYSGYPISSSSVAIRKNLLEQISGFPINIQFGEDQNTWMRLALLTNFAYLNKPLSIYHREYPSLAEKNRRKHFGNQYRHSDFLLEAIESKKLPPRRKQNVLELLAKFYYPEIRKNIIAGNRKAALDMLMKIRGIKISRWRWVRFCFSIFLPNSLLKAIYKPDNGY